MENSFDWLYLNFTNIPLQPHHHFLNLSNNLAELGTIMTL